MCIISVLPKGKQKYSDQAINFITNGFNNNEDGSGFMYKKAGTNHIIVSKGYFALDWLLKDLKKANLKDEDELIIHHRIGNVGNINIENCHPFVCSKDSEEIANDEIKIEKPCIAHNGTLTDIWKYRDIDKSKSDTYCLARYMFSESSIIKLLFENRELFDKLFSSIINTSKIAMLLPDRDLLMIGTFVEDDGYFHSNMGYKDGWFRDVGGTIRKKPENLPCAINQKPPLALPQQNNNQNPSGKEYSSADNENYKTRINKILNKIAITLDGTLIRINEFNFKYFLFTYQNVRHIHYDKVFKFQSFDPKAAVNYLVNKELNNPHVEYTISVSEARLHTDFEFLCKKGMDEVYSEYLIMQRDFEVSKSFMKKLCKMLRNARQKPLTHMLDVKGPKVRFSKHAVLEYYMYYMDDFMNDDTDKQLKYLHSSDTLIKDYKKDDMNEPEVNIM